MCKFEHTPLTSMFGNFLMTSLMEDSNVLSDRNAGFEFASPHACQYEHMVNEYKQLTCV